MNEIDVRWEQRFSNYRKALAKLTIAVNIITADDDIINSNEVDQLQYEGLIQRFEYTHELAWNVLKDYAKYQGFQDINGSRDAFTYGLRNGILDNEAWMGTIVARNRTSHTYDENTALDIKDDIIKIYHNLFLEFEQKMFGIQNNVVQQKIL